MSDESRIRILTLNCWGLKYFSKNRAVRIAALAEVLSQADSDYDLICFQELWVAADYNLLKARLTRLPYARFFYSGALGSGLAIFSRYPTIAASIHPYALNGLPLDVAAGDWFVGKAAASVIIKHPLLGQVQVFNTHLFAKGGEDGPEYNRAHRLVGAWEFSKLARHAAELGRYVIAAGDFNSIPTTLPMTIIRQHAGLADAWATVQPHSSSTASPYAIPPPHEAITQFGVTADSPLNSYSAGKPLDPYARKFWGKRLDYILFRQPQKGFHISPMTGGVYFLQCTSAKVVLTDLVPGSDFSYSDHFGLECTLEIRQATGDVIADPDDPFSSSPLSPPPLPPPPLTVPTELADADISSIIQALSSCYRFSRYRSSRELLLSALCILLLLGLVIGSPWLPKQWLNPLFILFTIALSWLGTTMFYEGLLYGRWERNALMSVIEELELHRKGIAA